MKPMKTNKRIRPIGLLGALLLLAPVAPMAFTACDTEPAEITITMKSDFSRIIQAINDANKSLTEKLSLIETATTVGFASDEEAQKLIQQAIESLTGTLAEKLAAVETAVKSHTASLETKLALIEAAVANGFADDKAQQELIKTAIESLTGTVAERLKAIETTLQSESLSLGTKLDLISSAMESKLADNQKALEFIRQAIESLGGTMDEKLVAIETAIKSQTTSFDTKLAAIEAAVSSGFADAKAQQELLQEAIESLGGTMEEKLAAIEAAVQGQTASLETKLALIEKAVTNGLADANAGQELIRKAIESLGGELGGQLASLLSAVESQTISLDKKLELIEAAIKNNSASSETGYELIKKAIETLGGSLEEKLVALDTAITRQTTTLDTKLTAIEAAVKEGFAADTAALRLIRQAVEAIPGSINEKLAAIEEAISDPNIGLTVKLEAIATAVTDGFASAQQEQDLIQKAIESLQGTMEQKLGAIDTAIQNQTLSLERKFDLIQGALAAGLDSAKTAIRQMTAAVNSLKECVDGDQGLISQIDSVATALGKIDTSLKDNVAKALTDILGAINGLTDYGDILTAIQEAIENLGGPLSIEFSDQYVKDDVVQMPVKYTLSIPYTITAETTVTVEVVSSGGITATVAPDSANPLQGTLEIKSPASIEEGKAQVEVKVSNQFRSLTRTLAVEEAVLCFVKDEDKNVSYNYLDQRLQKLSYQSNLQGCTIDIPDDAKPWVILEGTEAAVAPADSSIILTIKANTETWTSSDRETDVTVRNPLGFGDLVFHITQKGQGDEPIRISCQKLMKDLVSNELVNPNNDKYVTYNEAAAVTSLYSMFYDVLYGKGVPEEYTSFKEFQYFTGITTIPAGSFNNWKNLKIIILPESIETIEIDFTENKDGSPSDQTILRNCALDSIKGKFATPDGQGLMYKRKGETTYKLVKVAENATGFVVPDGVDTIASYCFYNSKVKNVTLPSSLKTIGESAFEYSDIESVSLPLGGNNPDVDTCRVTRIYERTFAHCYNLKSFYGARVNGKWKVWDNRVLYHDTTMVAYALAATKENIEIPDDLNIKRLSDHLFEMTDRNGNPLSTNPCKLKTIALPSGINSIGSRTFYNHTNLLDLYFKSSTIPSRCGGQAFGNISELIIRVPQGSSLDDFANKLNYNNIQTWDEWPSF